MSDESPFYAPTHTIAPTTTTPRRVLGRLWSRQKHGATLICILVAAPVGEELRLMLGDDLYRTELCVDRAHALKKAETMRLQLEARGWLP